MYMDLDNFKNHQRHPRASDRRRRAAAGGRCHALVGAAGRRRRRLGGDEFAVLMPETGCPARGLRRAKRLIASLRNVFKGTPNVTASIGVRVRHSQPTQVLTNLLRTSRPGDVRREEVGERSGCAGSYLVQPDSHHAARTSPRAPKPRSELYYSVTVPTDRSAYLVEMQINNPRIRAVSSSPNWPLAAYQLMDSWQNIRDGPRRGQRRRRSTSPSTRDSRSLVHRPEGRQPDHDSHMPRGYRT